MTRDLRTLAEHITAEALRPDPQALAAFRARGLGRGQLRVLRDLADLLRFWRICGRKACAAAQRCARSDAICCGERAPLVDAIFLKPFVAPLARERVRKEPETGFPNP